MADLHSYEPRVLAVLASSDACTHLAGFPGAGRVAPEEIVIVGEASLAAIEHAVRPIDPDAVVADVSDGWTAVAIEGAGARDVFARLSELQLPLDGFAQGEFARIAGRIFVEGDRIDVLVPATVAEHVRGRIQSDAGDLLR